MLTKIKTTSKKALSLMLIFVMSFTALVLCNPIEADALEMGYYVEGRYYYYPAGTQFISSIQFGQAEKGEDAEGEATANGHTVLKNDNGDRIDFNSGVSKVDYIFLGYKTSTDINQAFATFLRAGVDNGGTASYNFDVITGSGKKSVAFTNLGQDLNDDAGGAYIYMYYTQSTEVGLPIVALTGSVYGSVGANTKDGYYAFGGNDGTAVDCNQGSGGDYVYMFFDNSSVYTDITSTVQGLIDILAQTSAVKDKSLYTAESWAAYESALNEANRIWGIYNNKYKAGYATVAEINAAVNNLGKAMDGLKTTIRLDAVTNGGTTSTTEYTVSVGLNDYVDFPAGQYNATREGYSFLGWNTDKNSSSGSKYNIRVPLNSTVYAIFAITQYSVYFSNPITLQTISTQNVAYGGSAVAPVMDQYLKNDLDVHYVFNGWDRDFTNITESITVKAVYTAAEHKYSRIQHIPATCIKDGSELYKCSECGQEKSVVLPKDPDSHINVQEYPEKASTCKEYGYTAYTYCNDCRTIVSGRELLPLAGCTWSDWSVTEPTCEAPGVKTRRCTVCGKTESEAIPATGHEWSEWSVAKDATCEAAGRRQRRCPKCSTTEVEMIPALGHEYKETVTPPTCTEKGYTTHTCERDCGSYYVDSYVDALDHDWNDVGAPEREATCTDSGLQYQECSVCSSSRTAVVPALGHNWKNETIIKDATCDTDGSMNATCDRCSLVQEGIVIPAFGHDWDEGVTTKPATCTEDGNILLTCQRECGKTMNIPVKATGHDWDDGVITTAPTCSYEGKKIVTCRVCTETDTVDVPKLNHKYAGVVTAPTCVDQGYTEYKCSECGDEVVEDFVAATGHSFSITVVPPTCIKEGYTFSRCSNCEHTQKTSFVSALGHDYRTTVVDPTCTEKGYDYHVCTRGDSTYKDNYVDVLGHDYVKTVVAPTCTERGYDLYDCARCDIYYKQNYVKETGHSYIEIDRVDPYGTQSGYVLYKCSGCDHERKKVLYRDSKALVCITLFDQHGNPVKEATISVTEMITGRTFTLYTDLNGYFTEVLPEGEYMLVITKLGYEDTTGFIVVDGGDADIDIPTVDIKECDCNCHKNDIWARIWRIFMKIAKFLGIVKNCCDDPQL